MAARAKLATPLQRAAEAMIERIRPPKRILPSEWAESHVRLTDGDRTGYIRFNRGYEFQREILDTFFATFEPGEKRRVGVCFKGAQAGITTLCQIGLLYRAIHTKRSVFHLLPREFDAQDKGKKIGEMCSASPKLRNAFKRSQQRVRKTVDGQTFRVAYSNSESELKNWQAGDGVFDEVDELECRDFDSIAMAKQRMGSYRKRLELYIGTPKLPDFGIDKVWQDSDQRHYYIPCPICQAEQALTWEGNIEWSDEPDTDEAKAATARFKCASCNKTWDQRTREKANARGAWRAHKPENPVIGFAVSRLYVPSSNPEKLVSDYLAGLKSDQAMREHVNQNLGQTYMPTTGKLDEKSIEACIDDSVAWGKVPEGTVMTTVGIDVQGEQEPFTYVYEARAFDSEGFARVFSYGFLRGDDEVEALLGTAFATGRWPIARALADISDGHHKMAVERLCQKIPCLEAARFDHTLSTKFDAGSKKRMKRGRGHALNREDVLDWNLSRFYDVGERGRRIALAPCPQRPTERAYIDHYTKIARVKKDTARGPVYVYRKLRQKDVDFPFAGALAEYAREVSGGIPGDAAFGAVKPKPSKQASAPAADAARSAVRVVGATTPRARRRRW